MGSDDEEDESPLEVDATPTLDTPKAATANVIVDDVSMLHSLSDNPSPRSLKLVGVIARREIHILIDTGSTHNFIHPLMAEKLSLQLKSIKPFRVLVGNGASIPCSHCCPQIILTIQNLSFTVDIHVLPIHGPDLILGMRWLRSLGKVTHDYEELTMDFVQNDRPVQLRGITTTPRKLSVHAVTMCLTPADPCEFYELVQVLPKPAEPATATLPASLPATVRATLERHATVFHIPSRLPPARSLDHRIHLLSGSKPVNVRPYRYSYFQKNEIERQVREMLEQGIIQRSQSPFS